ncbi:conserved hypothetical protein [Prochlorococcus marinus subsp. pastoris str. CCMP1986]|uniref:SxtJ n=1 Tax=Prochlorococcus marinus subsp. pastoris (strain CCMP1986 / NIES-2087 / MED4) TaxID=59919 RepID=Q7V0K6_PROMP|nr:SxtJ family membrane protein [Prochlorococcus marinus]KGF87188.1 hypothetical protein PROCH_0774 [Prochlorococcus marinus str. EQPAC1]CAE19709.1 conserved hypothetical protein [Prochlorococcus marinus subsp. pastoris str. CCMP1986]
MSEKITKKKLREFGILIGIGFPFLIGWIMPSFAGHGFREWTLLIGIPGLIIGLIAPRILLYPYKGWMLLGHKLGWVNSHLVLGLVFILVLLPIALIMRISGYDPLRKKRKDKKTYRENKQNHQTDITRIF